MEEICSVLKSDGVLLHELNTLVLLTRSSSSSSSKPTLIVFHVVTEKQKMDQS